MPGTAIRHIVILAALASLTVTSARADEVKPPPPSSSVFSNAATLKKSSGFYSKFLAPRLDQRLHGDRAAALDFTNRSANPWMRDNESVDRMEKHALRATKAAIKRYAVERLGLDTWSVPIKGGSGSGLDSMRTESGGTRLRFGFSHRRPRAELVVPSTSGRFAVSVDGRGNVGASFEAKESMFRFTTFIEPSEHTATFGMVARF